MRASGSRARRRASRKGPAAPSRSSNASPAQGRRRRVGREETAVRAGAAPLRPHLAAARREPPLRLLREAHAPGGPEPVRGEEGDHVPEDVEPLPLRRPRPAAQADRRDAAPDRRVPGARAVRHRPRAAPARPRRQRRRRRRPPRDHPHRRRAPHLRLQPADERRIFDLVARRFLAVFRPPPARYERTDGRHAGRGGDVLPHPRQGHARPGLAGRLRPRGRRRQGARRGGRERRDPGPGKGPGGSLRRRRGRGQGDEAAAPLQRGHAALRHGGRRQAHR